MFSGQVKDCFISIFSLRIEGIFSDSAFHIVFFWGQSTTSCRCRDHWYHHEAAGATKNVGYILECLVNPISQWKFSEGLGWWLAFPPRSWDWVSLRKKMERFQHGNHGLEDSSKYLFFVWGDKGSAFFLAHFRDFLKKSLPLILAASAFDKVKEVGEVAG